jgi:hypothetical protein
MRVLLVNLKHLYQNPRCWLAYGFFAVVIGLNVGFFSLIGGASARHGVPVFLLYLSLGIGVSVGKMQTRSMRYPFALYLPGRQAAARSVVFLAGLFTGFAFAILFVCCLNLPDRSVVRLGLVFLSTFSFYLAVSLIGTVLAFTDIGGELALLFLWMFGSYSAPFLSELCPGVTTGIERALVHWPVLTITVATFSTALCWWWLGRPIILRRSREWLAFELSLPSIAEAAWSRERCHGADLWAGRFFLERVRRTSLPWSWRCVWGTLYLILSTRVGWGLVIWGLVVILWGSYGPSYAPVLIAVTLVGGTVPNVDGDILPLLTRLLEPVGRRQRFFATMTLLGISWVAAIFWTTFLILGSILFVSVVPDIAIGKSILKPQPMNMSLLLLPLVLAPTVSLVCIIVRRKPLWMCVFLIVLVVFFWSPWDLWRIPTVGRHTLVWLVVSWVVCAYGVHRIAMHSDLGRR